MTQGDEKAQLAALENIRNRAKVLSSKTIVLGFDAFIDSVVKVIRNKDGRHATSYFESAHELGEYMIEKGQKNFSLELEEKTSKLGGNMPIMANALAQFGSQISCIGPLGYPVIHPVFRQMPSNCTMHSFGEPGLSKIMEFQTGKMMLAEMEALNRIEWKFIRDTIGVDTFIKLFSGSDLIALLNWSELDNSTEIWRGILSDVMPLCSSEKRPLGFFDLSDCSKRTSASILDAMEMIKSFSAYWEMVLSLNLNEGTIIHSILNKKNQREENIDRLCEEIFNWFNVGTIVIHHAKGSIARNKDGIYKKKSFFIKEPTISTGSGDNFNAGFCAGRLMDLEMGTALTLGHASSHLYMRSAKSPGIMETIEFMSGNLADCGTLVVNKGT